jgi:hypothetical protein
MTPVMMVGGETVIATISGLTPFRDRYIAIVAVDVLGNRNPAVITSTAYVVSPQVISREVSLFVGDEPPYQQVVSREVSLAVTGAVSRKNHNGTDFDLALPLTGTPRCGMPARWRHQ